MLWYNLFVKMTLYKFKKIVRLSVNFTLIFTLVFGWVFEYPIFNFNNSVQKVKAAEIAQYTGGLLVYGDNTAGAVRYRTFDDTNGFGTEQSATAVASAIEWIRVAASPTRDEWIIVTRDSGDRIAAQVCTGVDGGVSCGATTSISATAGTHGFRNYDVAYEQTSGDALIVYGTNTADELRKIEWNGTSWVNDVAVTTTNTSGTVEWVELTARPASDQIGIAYSDTNDDVAAYRWSGTAIENERLITLSAVTGDVRKFDVSFEGTSGDMFVAAPLSGAGTIDRGMLVNTTWSSSTDNAPDSVTAYFDMQEPGPDNDIAMIGQGTAATNNPTEAYEWSGTAIVDGSVATDGTTLNWAANYQTVSTAYVNSTYYAVAVFADVTGADDINWWTMNSAGTWTVQADNTRTRGTIRFQKLYDYPNNDKVLLLSSDANSDLWADTWNGAATGTAVWADLTSGGTLEGTLSSATTEVYDFAFRLKSVTPGVPTFFDTDGTNQIAFNNIRQATTTPTFRVSALSGATMNRFQIQMSTTSDFTSTTYTQTFTGSYASGTATNLTASSLSPTLPTTDNTTYFVRARASTDGGTSYGSWSTSTRTFTYKTYGNPDWSQTLDEQFVTDTLTSATTTGSDSVGVSSINNITPLGIVQSTKWEPGVVGTTVPFTLNTQPTVGNLLLAFVGSSDYSENRTVSAPDGTWTKIEDQTNGNVQLTVWWKIVQGGDGTGYTFNISGSTEWMSGVLYEIQGADTTTPINQSSSTIGSQTSPAITPTVLGTLALAALETDDGSVGGITLTNVSAGWTSDHVARPQYHTTYGASRNSTTTSTSTSIFNVWTLSGSATSPAAATVLINPSGFGSYFTDFSEYTTGTQPTGWTQRHATSASAWIVRDDATATGGKVVRVEGPDSTRKMLSWDRLDSISANVEIFFRFKVPAITEDAFVAARGSGSASGDTVAVRSGYNNSGAVKQIGQYSAGTFSSLLTTGFTPTVDTWYSARASWNGNNYKYKSWLSSTAEPGTWDIETSSSTVTAAGWIGLASFSSDTTGGVFDVFSVNTTGASAATSSPSATTGTVMSTPISFNFVPGASAWKQVNWTTTETSGSTTLQIYYSSSTACDTLIPNSALPGNSTGFSAESSPLDISALSTSTYSTLCLKATLNKSGSLPTLNDWSVKWDGNTNPSIAQLNYRWRFDNGSESTASYIVDTNTAITTGVYIGDRVRLRLMLENSGTDIADSHKYKIEYGSMTNSCATWTAIPSATTTGPWSMDSSSYVSDNSVTTDSSGIANPGGKTFTAGYVKTADNQTLALNITPAQFTEIEYSIRSTSNATQGLTYCFRVTNAGTTTNMTYPVRPEISLVSYTLFRSGGGSNIENSATPSGQQGGGSTGGGSGTEQSTTSTSTSTSTPPAGGGGGDVGLFRPLNAFVFATVLFSGEVTNTLWNFIKRIFGFLVR